MLDWSSVPRKRRKRERRREGREREEKKEEEEEKWAEQLSSRIFLMMQYCLCDLRPSAQSVVARAWSRGSFILVKVQD